MYDYMPPPPIFRIIILIWFIRVSKSKKFLYCFFFHTSYILYYLILLLSTPPPLLCRFPFQSSPLNSSINAKAVAVTFWMQTLANITTSSDSSTRARRQHAPLTDDDDEEGPNQNLISSWWVPAIWCCEMTIKQISNDRKKRIPRESQQSSLIPVIIDFKFHLIFIIRCLAIMHVVASFRLMMPIRIIRW